MFLLSKKHQRTVPQNQLWDTQMVKRYNFSLTHQELLLIDSPSHHLISSGTKIWISNNASHPRRCVQSTCINSNAMVPCMFLWSKTHKSLKGSTTELLDIPWSRGITHSSSPVWPNKVWISNIASHPVWAFWITLVIEREFRLFGRFLDHFGFFFSFNATRPIWYRFCIDKTRKTDKVPKSGWFQKLESYFIFKRVSERRVKHLFLSWNSTSMACKTFSGYRIQLFQHLARVIGE